MTGKDEGLITEQIKKIAQTWNELYQALRFDDMAELACTDVGIANAGASTEASGLIFGRDNYVKGICGAYYGTSGTEHNLLVMKYEIWEYIPLNSNTFYTIGRYTLQNSPDGVNSWLLRRDSEVDPWRISRVINN